MDDTEKPEDKEKKTVKGLLTNFADNTSMHGAARIVSSSHIIWRLLWTLLVLAAAGVACYNVIDVIKTYLSNPVSTVVAVKSTNTLSFPAVTICNLNMVRKSMLPNITSQIHGYDEEYQDTTVQPATSTGTYTTTALPDDYDYDYYPEENYGMRDQIEVLLRKMDKGSRALFGHSMSRMLFSCVYQREQCTELNFTQFYDPDFGNCYTFNKDDLVKKVSRPGPPFGLVLFLNAEEHEYTDLTETVGFKIVVHRSKAMPFPAEEGIMISPGFTTNIAISKQEIHRAGQPYENCHRSGLGEGDYLNMYAPLFETDYTDKACRRTCYQRRVYENCDCCEPDLPCLLTTSKGSDQFVEDCNKTNEDIDKCVENVFSDYLTGKLGCTEVCLPACSEVIYTSEVSTGIWPSEPKEPELIYALKKASPTLDPSTVVDATYLRRNVARVQIYFKDTTYQTIESSPAYDWSRLVADLGGQLGLWLGFSLLTAVEILELITHVMHHVTRKAMCRAQREGRVRSEQTLK